MTKTNKEEQVAWTQYALDFIVDNAQKDAKDQVITMMNLLNVDQYCQGVSDSADIVLNMSNEKEIRGNSDVVALYNSISGLLNMHSKNIREENSAT